MSKIDFLGFINRKKISQTKLASMLGVTTATVNMYCKGRSGIGFDKVGVLVDLGITPEELFGKEVGGKLRNNILKESMPEPRELANLSDDAVIDIFSRGLKLMIGSRRVQ
ncbi:MAG: helix-turn-helix domain-containing protein [Fibromonadaceae bacterium]|jgi:transcriptional regulator with XRE-family HTH domain|nr:helix-turn-helix domain-containing protein [Fibromonadaceae bacterium]